MGSVHAVETRVPDNRDRSVTTDEKGERLIASYKCRRCHTIKGRGEHIGPDLRWEGEKLNTDWLFSFLKAPFKIRPLKIQEMPEFGMPDEDVHRIIEYFAFPGNQKNGQRIDHTKNTSSQDIEDGEMLFRHVLGCAGCHSINGQGGWAGPELSNTGGRLRPGWLGKWLENPQAIYPDTNMPRYKLKDWEIKALSAYLLTLKTEISEEDTDDDYDESGYDELDERPLYVSQDFLKKLPEKIDDSSTGKELYLWYCASCHGTLGDARGFNATYLDPRPRNFLRNKYLAGQTDEALKEIITKGGRVVGKAPYMPPWGKTLSEKKIRSIIRHLRDLSI